MFRSNNSLTSFASSPRTGSSIGGSVMTARSVGSSVGKAKMSAQGTLSLHVIGARELGEVYLDKSTGPYLSICLGKTRVKTGTDCQKGKNPEWNESFTFHISSADISSTSVLFQVKNKKLKASSVIGAANVKLLSLVAKNRSIGVPLKTPGSRAPAGFLRLYVKFESWNGDVGGNSTWAPPSAGRVGHRGGDVEMAPITEDQVMSIDRRDEYAQKSDGRQQRQQHIFPDYRHSSLERQALSLEDTQGHYRPLPPRPSSARRDGRPLPEPRCNSRSTEPMIPGQRRGEYIPNTPHQERHFYPQQQNTPLPKRAPHYERGGRKGMETWKERRQYMQTSPSLLDNDETYIGTVVPSIIDFTPQLDDSSEMSTVREHRNRSKRRRHYSGDGYASDGGGSASVRGSGMKRAGSAFALCHAPAF